MQAGQRMSAGDTIGGIGAAGGKSLTQTEAIGFCPNMGTWAYLDPTLVTNGFYNERGACEGLV